MNVEHMILCLMRAIVKQERKDRQNFSANICDIRIREARPHRTTLIGMYDTGGYSVRINDDSKFHLEYNVLKHTSSTSESTISSNERVIREDSKPYKTSAFYTQMATLEL